jgi:hypothetical protein
MGTGLADARRDTDQRGLSQVEEDGKIIHTRTASEQKDSEEWERDELRCHLGESLASRAGPGGCWEDPSEQTTQNKRAAHSNCVSTG